MIYLTPEQQQQRLIECLADQTCRVAYWCSDQWGGPANHQCDNYGAEWRAYPGRVDDIGGSPSACSDRGLHGTDYPHQWKGSRVWIVGLWNWVEDDNKYAATKREIVCEIAPESVIDPAIALRMQLPNLLIVGSSFYRSRFYGSSFGGSSFGGSYISYTCTFVGAQFKNCTGITKDQRAMMAARGALFVDVETE